MLVGGLVGWVSTNLSAAERPRTARYQRDDTLPSSPAAPSINAAPHCSRRRRVRTIRPPPSIRQDDDRTLAPGAVVALGV